MSQFVQVPFAQQTPLVTRTHAIDQIPLGRSVMFTPKQRTPFLGYIRSCGQEERRGAYKWDGRREEEQTIFQYTVAGEGRLQVGGKTYELKPGTAMLLVFPHAHKKYWLPVEQASWRFIFVTLAGQHIVTIWKWLLRRAGHVVALPGDAEPVTLACEICRRAHQGAFDDDFLSADFAYRLTFSLCEFLLHGKVQEGLPEALVLAKEFIGQNSHRPISTPDVAKAANASLNHVTELFRLHANTTPRAFLEQRRLERACFLLNTTQQPISEISEISGFSNSNYFAKVFRRLMGTSPGAYRSKMK